MIAFIVAVEALRLLARIRKAPPANQSVVSRRRIDHSTDPSTVDGGEGTTLKDSPVGHYGAAEADACPTGSFAR
jgi:hypothetical protein